MPAHERKNSGQCYVKDAQELGMINFTTNIAISDAIQSTLFGTNVLHGLNTESTGDVLQGFAETVEIAGVSHFRFPGGMAELDFNPLQLENHRLRPELEAFLDYVADLSLSNSDVSVTIVLPTQSYIESHHYASFAKLVAKDYPGLVSGFELGNEYSLGARNPNGLIDGHPEGSEVRPTQFGLTEAIYGQQVDRIVQALEVGFEAARVADPSISLADKPDYLMQMSDILGASSSFKGTNDHKSADVEILSQISAEVMAEIDGYVGHYYYNKPHTGDETFTGTYDESRSFFERTSSWRDSVTEIFGTAAAEKGFFFTEWNTNIRNHEQLGMKGASVLAEQIEQMALLGVTEAHVWPLEHNTNTALGGHQDNDMTFLSPAGVVFAELSRIVAEDDGQFRVLDLSATGASSSLEINALGSGDKTVLVISNRSFEDSRSTINLTDQWDNIGGIEVRVVGIDGSTSDGLSMGGDENGNHRVARRQIDAAELAQLRVLPFFDSNNPNHIKWVNGKATTYLPLFEQIVPKFSGATDMSDFWFLTEFDVGAKITEAVGQLDSAGNIEIVLNPFEVVFITFSHTSVWNEDDFGIRLDGSGGNDSLSGHSGDDTLIGGGGDDVLYGNEGNDIFDGGSGKNSLFGGDGDDIFRTDNGIEEIWGGSGFDTVDYASARYSVQVDLLNSSQNGGVARGDVFHDVESVVGTRYSDTIFGSNGEDVLIGNTNVDHLYGRVGDDELYGGIGDDVLFGGEGADFLDGGSGRDRVQYSDSSAGVTVNLSNPNQNTGDAFGDVFVSIEDVAGSEHEDTIFGDAGSNQIFGRAGADQLFGSQGNDYLNGGGGRDVLNGGAGDDTLRGGDSADVFVFNGGHDVIEDFDIKGDSVVLELSRTSNLGQAKISTTENGVLCEFDEGGSLEFLNFTMPQFSDEFL